MGQVLIGRLFGNGRRKHLDSAEPNFPAEFRRHPADFLSPTTLALTWLCCGSQVQSKSKATRISQGLLQLVEMREIVLDPELRSGLFDESLYRSPARQRLIAIELESRALSVLRSS